LSEQPTTRFEREPLRAMMQAHARTEALDRKLLTERRRSGIQPLLDLWLDAALAVRVRLANKRSDLLRDGNAPADLERVDARLDALQAQPERFVLATDLESGAASWQHLAYEVASLSGPSRDALVEFVASRKGEIDDALEGLARVQARQSVDPEQERRIRELQEERQRSSEQYDELRERYLGTEKQALPVPPPAAFAFVVGGARHQLPLAHLLRESPLERLAFPDLHRLVEVERSVARGITSRLDRTFTSLALSEHRTLIDPHAAELRRHVARLDAAIARAGPGRPFPSQAPVLAAPLPDVSDLPAPVLAAPLPDVSELPVAQVVRGQPAVTPPERIQLERDELPLHEEPAEPAEPSPPLERERAEVEEPVVIAHAVASPTPKEEPQREVVAVSPHTPTVSKPEPKFPVGPDVAVVPGATAAFAPEPVPGPAPAVGPKPALATIAQLQVIASRLRLERQLEEGRVERPLPPPAPPRETPERLEQPAIPHSPLPPPSVVQQPPIPALELLHPEPPPRPDREEEEDFEEEPPVSEAAPLPVEPPPHLVAPAPGDPDDERIFVDRTAHRGDVHHADENDPEAVDTWIGYGEGVRLFSDVFGPFLSGSWAAPERAPEQAEAPTPAPRVSQPPQDPEPRPEKKPKSESSGFFAKLVQRVEDFAERAVQRVAQAAAPRAEAMLRQHHPDAAADVVHRVAPPKRPPEGEKTNVLDEPRRLDALTLNRMESFLQGDFQGVRVHTGKGAEQITSRYGAEAVTVADHVFFAPGKFNPNTLEGEKLIAHELTHVLQKGRQNLDVRTAEAEALRAEHHYGKAPHMETLDLRRPEPDFKFADFADGEGAGLAQGVHTAKRTRSRRDDAGGKDELPDGDEFLEKVTGRVYELLMEELEESFESR
jgi:Domain of unknown function (DUF4157)